MGRVLRFPLERRRVLTGERLADAAGAAIVILPVVRIERHPSKPEAGVTVGGKPHPGGDRPKRRRKSA